MVSQLLNKGVWELLDVPEPYLDLQLTLNSIYPEGKLIYTNRKVEEKNKQDVEEKAHWSDVLRGKALENYHGSIIKVPQHLKDRANRLKANTRGWT
jgi:hypothetical protein